MLPFKPNRRYTSVALYAAATIAVVILFATLVIRFASVSDWFARIISALAPLLYALVLAYFLRPLVLRFEGLFSKVLRVDKREDTARRRALLGVKWLSIACAYLFVSLCLFLFIFYLIPLLAGDTQQLWQRLFGLSGTLVEFVNSVGADFGVKISTADIANLIYNSRATILAAAAEIGTAISMVTFDLFLGVCLSVGILLNRGVFAAHVRRMGMAIFSFRGFRYIRRTVNYANEVFGKYIIGKIVECAIIGLLYLIVLPLIGVPYPFLITLIMTITNFIPIIGAILGGIPSGILILTGDNPLMAVWFIIIVLIVEQIDGNIVFPKVIGSIINLRAVWIMIAVAFFGGMYGVLGMFLSVPIFSVLYMLVRDAINHLLLKKGFVTDTEFYSDLFASTAPPRRRRFKYHFFFGEREPHEDGDKNQK